MNSCYSMLLLVVIRRSLGQCSLVHKSICRVLFHFDVDHAFVTLCTEWISNFLHRIVLHWGFFYSVLIPFIFWQKKLAKEKQKNASVMNRTILFKSVRRSATKNDKHKWPWIGFILLVVVTLGIFVIPFVHDIMIIESNDKCNHIRWFYFEIRTL